MDYRPEDVPFTIKHGLGSDTVEVDQRMDGGQWNLLGSFYFEDQGSVTVSDAVSSGSDVVADAIRLEYQGPGRKKMLSRWGTSEIVFDENGDGRVNGLDWASLVSSI